MPGQFHCLEATFWQQANFPGGHFDVASLKFGEPIVA